MEGKEETNTSVETCAVSSSFSISPLSTFPTIFVRKSLRSDVFASRLQKEGVSLVLQKQIEDKYKISPRDLISCITGMLVTHCLRERKQPLSEENNDREMAKIVGKSYEVKMVFDEFGPEMRFAYSKPQYYMQLWGQREQLAYRLQWSGRTLQKLKMAVR